MLIGLVTVSQASEFLAISTFDCSHCEVGNLSTMTQPSGNTPQITRTIVCVGSWTVNPNWFMNEFHTLKGSYLFNLFLGWEIFLCKSALLKKGFSSRNTEMEISQESRRRPLSPRCWFVFSISFFPAGESGLGKSTLINSLFLTDLYSSDYPGPSHRIKKTVQVQLVAATPLGLQQPSNGMRHLLCTLTLIYLFSTSF